MVTAVTKLKMLAPWKNSYDKAKQHVKKQKHQFADKAPYSQRYGFLVVMYRLSVRPQRRLSTKELMLTNCGAGEDS